jgi:hypothetical protein
MNILTTLQGSGSGPTNLSGTINGTLVVFGDGRAVLNGTIDTSGASGGTTDPNAIHTDATSQTKAGPLTLQSGLAIGVAGTALASLDFPTIGNAGKFSIISGGATFNSQADDVLYWGYNVANGGAKINSAEPNIRFSLESHYFSGGIHAMEYNLDCTNQDGSVSTRPYYFLFNRVSGTEYFHILRMGSTGSSQFAILDHAGTTTLFSMSPAGNALIATDLQMARTSGDPAIQATGSNKSIRLVTGLGTVYILGNSASQSYVGVQIGDSKINNDVANTLSISQNFTVGRKLFLTPSGGLTLTAPSAVTVAYSIVQINAASNITLTSTPTIAAGTDGQVILLYNYGSNTITLQDQSQLGGSNLRLTAATLAIGPKQSIWLFYSTAAGAWVQVGNLAAVIGG